MEENDNGLAVRLAEFLDSHRFGKYRGKIAEVGEGDKLGLVRAIVPEIYQEQPSPWARPSVPFAGKDHGWVALPEKDDGVWIEFETGDISKPIWSGFWWAKGELPEPAGVKTRVLATTEGHKLILDDERGEIKIEHGEGPSITITGSDITLTVGSKKIVISDSGVTVNDGALEVK